MNDAYKPAVPGLTLGDLNRKNQAAHDHAVEDAKKSSNYVRPKKSLMRTLSKTAGTSVHYHPGGKKGGRNYSMGGKCYTLGELRGHLFEY